MKERERGSAIAYLRMRVFEEFTKHPREAPRDLRVLQRNRRL
jgi:hypothetical protein